MKTPRLPLLDTLRPVLCKSAPMMSPSLGSKATESFFGTVFLVVADLDGSGALGCTYFARL